MKLRHFLFWIAIAAAIAWFVLVYAFALYIAGHGGLW